MSAVRNELASSGPGGLIWAYLPLSLLLAIRAHDRPGEVLQDEDLAASLPRRLGLSDVIEREIRTYQRAARRRRRADAGGFESLVRLVLRRPDSEAILRDTGQRVAAEYIRRVPRLWRRTARALPARASLAVARRAAARLLRRMVGDGEARLMGKPALLHVRSKLAATDSTCTACVLYSAAIEAVVREYAGERPRIHQMQCACHGAAACEWTVAEE